MMHPVMLSHVVNNMVCDASKGKPTFWVWSKGGKKEPVMLGHVQSSSQNRGFAVMLAEWHNDSVCFQQSCAKSMKILSNSKAIADSTVLVPAFVCLPGAHTWMGVHANIVKGCFSCRLPYSHMSALSLAFQYGCFPTKASKVSVVC